MSCSSGIIASKPVGGVPGVPETAIDITSLFYFYMTQADPPYTSAYYGASSYPFDPLSGYRVDNTTGSFAPQINIRCDNSSVKNILWFQNSRLYVWIDGTLTIPYNLKYQYFNGSNSLQTRSTQGTYVTPLNTGLKSFQYNQVGPNQGLALNLNGVNESYPATSPNRVGFCSFLYIAIDPLGL